VIELFDLAINAQRRVIDAHEQSLEAARKSLGVGHAVVTMQQAMQDAAKANLSAWQQWLSLWGWRK